MKSSRRPAVLVVTQAPDCKQVASTTTMISSECYNLEECSEVDIRSLTRQRVLEQRVTSQARELGALRHVLERLKGAVFHCDAQNTALQVALKKQQSPPRKVESCCESNCKDMFNDLCQLRETLVFIMIKVKEMEEQLRKQKRMSSSLKIDACRLTTIDEVEFISDDVNPKRGNKSSVDEELQIIKKQWKIAEKEWDQERLCLLDEINSRQLDCEEQETELRLIEAERIRLATQESKLSECLKLLRNLKLMNFSKRTIGKILIDSLGNYRDKNPEVQVFNFLDSFYETLINYDLELKNSLIPLALNINIED